MAQHRLSQKLRDRLKEARKHLGLAQSKFAIRIGLGGQPDVSKLERGPTNEIDDDLLHKIAEATGKAYDWLLHGTGEDDASQRYDGGPTALSSALSRGAPGPVEPSVDRSPIAAAADVMDISAPPRSNSDIFSFIRSLVLPSVRRFMLMAITGESTVKDFLTALEEHASKVGAPIECQILLRSPFSTDKKRSESFAKTRTALRNFHARYPNFVFEIRTYSSSVPLHAVMCEHRDPTFSACLSWYLWRSPNSRETISTREPAMQGRLPEDDKRLEVYLSWFAHFWGKRKIHTILFDFDDTLFLTTQAQVDAWVHALKYSLEQGFLKPAQLKSRVMNALRSKSGAGAVMTKIFLDEQDEEHIGAKLFRKGVSAEILDLIRVQRSKKRAQLTRATAEPVHGVLADIRELGLHYQLIIVSATSESLINQILEDHDLGIFSYVIGREALRRHSWRFIEHKAQHFIRVSNMLGIPLERMIFVGDSDADFRAAYQLGLNYIESRYNAARYGRKSLIKAAGFATTHYISEHARPGELKKQIAKIEAELPAI